jgi:aminoglycoside phosphotransferase (APT) family kinase protein
MTAIDAALAERILAYAAQCGVDTGADARFELLSGGNSHITWRLRTPSDAPDLVIKVAQPDGPLAPYDVAHEGRMMARAFDAGVPAPKLVGHVQEENVQFILMEHVPGDSPSLWEVRQWLEGKPDSARIALGRSLLAILPMLAAANAGGEADLPAHYTAYLGKLVTDLEEAAAGLIALPGTFRAVQGWLEGHLPLLEGEAAALHHGDYRLGNAVFRDGEIVALLDWERAMIGHPLHDLGFLCLPGMRIGSHIGGILTEAELIALWPELTGRALDRRIVALFKAMSMFSELCLMVRALCRLARGRGRLTGARPLPLIARLHGDLLDAVMRWNDGDFAL